MHITLISKRELALRKSEEQALTYEPKYEGSNWQRTEEIQKKLVISEKENVGVSL